MMKNIPDKLTLFNVYKDGSKLIGVGEEVTLPDVEMGTETLSGPGILGEIDMPGKVNIGSMEQEISFRMLDEDIFSVMDLGEGVSLTLRAGMQRMSGTGGIEEVGIRVVERGIFKGMTTGSLKQGGPMSAGVKLELLYIRIEIDGEEKLEIDKLNCVYKVNGKDVLKKARELS
jgi:hypothetical protein